MTTKMAKFRKKIQEKSRWEHENIHMRNTNSILGLIKKRNIMYHLSNCMY